MSTGPGLGYHILSTGGAALPGSLQTNQRLCRNGCALRPDGVVEVLLGQGGDRPGHPHRRWPRSWPTSWTSTSPRVRMVAASTAMQPQRRR